MDRFTRFFTSPELTEDWYAVWGDGLQDLSGEQIKYGLSVVQNHHEWPPSLPEFKACCKSAPMPYKPLLKATKHGHSEQAEDYIAKINSMLAKPKRPGIWWKAEVRAKADRGENVSLLALELANSGMQE